MTGEMQGFCAELRQQRVADGILIGQADCHRLWVLRVDWVEKNRSLVLFGDRDYCVSQTSRVAMREHKSGRLESIATQNLHERQQPRGIGIKKERPATSKNRIRIRGHVCFHCARITVLQESKILSESRQLRLRQASEYLCHGHDWA
jgi:hypothetical protein